MPRDYILLTRAAHHSLGPAISTRRPTTGSFHGLRTNNLAHLDPRSRDLRPTTGHQYSDSSGYSAGEPLQAGARAAECSPMGSYLAAGQLDYSRSPGGHQGEWRLPSGACASNSSFAPLTKVSYKLDVTADISWHQLASASITIKLLASQASSRSSAKLTQA